MYGEAGWRCSGRRDAPRLSQAWALLAAVSLVFAWPINSVRSKSDLNGPQTYVPPAARVAPRRQRRKHKAPRPRKCRGVPVQHKGEGRKKVWILAPILARPQNPDSLLASSPITADRPSHRDRPRPRENVEFSSYSKEAPTAPARSLNRQPHNNLHFGSPRRLAWIVNLHVTNLVGRRLHIEIFNSLFLVHGSEQNAEHTAVISFGLVLLSSYSSCAFTIG